MNQKIAISRLHFPVTTLGPGRRLGIWFQGCSIRCPGCISVDTWDKGKEKISLSNVMQQIEPWLKACDGITISGGEPFDQPDALRSLLQALKALTSKDVLVYSGHSFERLQLFLISADGLIDALISDPYDLLAPQSIKLRGSDNQRLHLLTKLGKDRFCEYDRPIESTDRTLDVMFDDNGSIWFAGIPMRGDFKQLRTLLESDGATTTTTEDRRK